MKVGDEEIVKEFTMSLQSGCALAELTVSVQPESGLTYNLRDAQKVLFEYDLSSVVTSNLETNCGEPVIEFMFADEMALTEGAFVEDRSIEGAYKLSIGETKDTSIVGTNELVFKFYFSEQPSVAVKSEVFTVEVVNPCVPPEDSEFQMPTLKAPKLQD
jgi:hypothetical protein